MEIKQIFQGVPARSDRGYLGWSACFLIVTGSGRKVIFDTAGYNERSTLIDRLTSMDAPVSAIDMVVLSHFHFDHAANWDVFKNADIVLHTAELEYMDGADALRDPAVLRYHRQELGDAPSLRLIEAETDLGDGLIVLEVPGHTPGSVALKAEDDVFCGDALKNRNELWTGKFGGPLWDEDRALRSLDTLTSAGKRLYPGHDAVLERTNKGWMPGGISSIRIDLAAETEVCLHGSG